MNSEGEAAPYAKNRTKKIRTRPQMRDFAQKLGGVPFLLQWITLIRTADDSYFFCNEFPILTFALRLDQRTTDSNGSACVQSLYRRVIRQSISGDDLETAQT